MYLGYNALNELMSLVSSLTISVGQHVRVFCFDPVEVKGEHIMGVSISSISKDKEYYEELLKGFENIHINDRQFTKYDNLLIVGRKETVNKWYQQMRDGDIASKLIRHFGGSDGFIRADPKSIELIREEVAAITPSYSV